MRMCVCECKNVEGIKEFCKSKIDLKTFKAKKRSKIKFSKALIKRVGKRDNKNWPLFAEADFYDPIESSKLVYENSNAINFYFVLSKKKKLNFNSKLHFSFYFSKAFAHILQQFFPCPLDKDK